MGTYWDEFLRELPDFILKDKPLRYILELFYKYVNDTRKYQETLEQCGVAQVEEASGS